MGEREAPEDGAGVVVASGCRPAAERTAFPAEREHWGRGRRMSGPGGAAPVGQEAGVGTVGQEGRAVSGAPLG